MLRASVTQKLFRIFTQLLLLAGLLAAAGCAAPPPQGVTVTAPVVSLNASGNAEASAQAALPPKYLIGIGDELEIKFVDRPQLNEVTKVRPDGMISIGLAGTLTAGGRTPQQLEQDLGERYRSLGDGGENNGAKKEYLIHFNDQLEIKFSYFPQLDDEVTVLPDGKISLKLVKSVAAEGKSPERLTRELIQLYAKHLRLPDLVVIVKKFSSPNYMQGGRSVRSDVADLKPVVIVRAYAQPQIFVGGEVTKPGVLSYRPSLTLAQAIIEAGGNKASGEMRSVIVLRKGDAGQALTIRRDLQADIKSNTTNDIYLQPFDVVVVPKSAIAEVDEMLDQYVFSVIPFIKNSSFGFVDDLTPTSRKQTTVISQ